MNNYINEWNRKERLPDKTISLFMEAFKTVGINTEFKENSSHKGLWYSITLIDSENHKVATRGKGVSKEYSEASACGEFSERLQGNWLYRVPELKPHYIDIKEVSDDTKDYLIDTFGKINFLKINSKQSIYYEMISKLLVSLPDDLVEVYAGTNGLAAGNTKTDAFVQGTCEIFERYVIKMIYEGNYTEKDFPVLDRALYENLCSYKMLQEIENNGFQYYVKDCSLNGVFPVIGMLVMDSSRSRYCFCLSSDFNLDIALQRCITEIFQNFDIGINMKLQMHNKLESTDYWAKNIPDDYGFSKTLFNGTGQIPAWLLDCTTLKSDMVYPMGYEKLTNEQCKQEILNIVKKLNKKIYIKDCSFLNIPALRIVIPGLSNIYWKNTFIDYPTIITETLQLLVKERKEKDDLYYLYKNISVILTLPLFKYECSWKKIYGPYISVYYRNEEINIYLYYTALCIKQGNYDEAVKFLKKGCDFYSNTGYHQISYYAGIIIYGIRDDHDIQKIKEVVGERVNKEELEWVFGVIFEIDAIVGKIDISAEEQKKLNAIEAFSNKHKSRMCSICNYTDNLFA